MKVETENVKATEASAELVRELMADDARRGEFMILFDETDDENFVQVACDYDDVGGKSDGCFDLEYRTGQGSPLFHCTRRVSADDVERVFLDVLEGRVGWRQDFSWERQNMGGSSGFSTPRLRDLPRSGRILCVIGCAVGVLFSIIFLSHGLEELISVLRKPGTTPGDFVGAGVFALVPAIILGGGLFQFAQWFMTRGKRREAHERMIVAEGVRLRRVLPDGVVFMAIWCCGWDAAAFVGLVPRFISAVRDYPENGFCVELVIGIIFPLIGIAATVYFIRIVWRHLRPCYGVRLLGGVLKEGELATFEYEFNGDAESVKRVKFATAVEEPRGYGRTKVLGAPHGVVNDTKEMSHPMELVSGRVSLEMPRIASDCHDRFRYYFCATVTFKSGLVVSSSYRIPLK